MTTQRKAFCRRSRDRFARLALLFSLALGPTLAGLAETPKPAGASSKIDFNRQIRPILSENCYLCHGPDDKGRKGKLRLDMREEALKPAKSGTLAIVPGNPEKSEILVRVSEKDPDEVMPPVKTGKKLSPEQIDLLRSWIQEGAPYATHWAYRKPIRPEFPAVRNKDWPRNPVDYFILGRLEKEGLSPSPPADRPTLIRRLCLDLTGLPPTLEEVDQFVKDQSPAAYEALVDRVLSKKSYGEHWGQKWLDLARYADSAGYADDPFRSIWAFRDYVIRSFNNNKPFDRFTIEQIAGDLLENPEEEELTATAFHRNTMTNNEGGTNDEEFRNAAIVDRANTTMAVWMGTSLACAQCHNHKYDPISQEEYFRFFAFFNNTEDADKTDESPVLNFFTGPQKEQRKKLETTIQELDRKLSTPTEELLTEARRWRDGFPAEISWEALKPAQVRYVREGAVAAEADGVVAAAPRKGTDLYTLEIPLSGTQLGGLKLQTLLNQAAAEKADGSNAVPWRINRIAATFTPSPTNRLAGRFVRIELPGTNKILSLAEVQVFNPRENVALRGQASQSSTDLEAEASRAIDGNSNGDFNRAKSTTHTQRSENPWWQVDLGVPEEIERIVIWNRTDADTGRRLTDFRVALLDDNHQPVWEKTFKDSPNPSAEFPVNGPRPVRFTAIYADKGEQSADLTQLLADKPDPKKGWTPKNQAGPAPAVILLNEQPLTYSAGAKLTVSVQAASEDQAASFAGFKLYSTAEPRLAQFARAPGKILGILAAAEAQRAESEQKELIDYYLRNVAPQLQPERDQLAARKKELAEIKPKTVPIFHELAQDKRRKTRIQFRGNFMSLGDEVAEGVPAVFQPLPEGPRNRLTLAKWLVDPENPLTARVLANRFWEQIFGVGIVRTSEEFGSQGEPPVNQELLDWLATELIAQKWDLKGFLKLLVTSAAYAQSARVTPELQERDPDNRLLARGPRFRLSAEMVRDQALFVGGLLSDKMYGPSVKPPRPLSGLSAAFGSSVDWQPSEGEDRRRRGLYTEWRRTSPYPSMTTFDAPNREVCTIRRNRTNTPLQALVTLNDPVFLEAAQGLARRMLKSSEAPAERMAYGFRLCLARPPNETETGRLLALLDQATADYKADPEKAAKMTAGSNQPAEAGEKIELAAWTTVANVLLNLDETLMKR